MNNGLEVTVINSRSGCTHNYRIQTIIEFVSEQDTFLYDNRVVTQ